MATAIAPQGSSVPPENWDDDFDFHSQSGSPKRHRNVHDPPATMRMSIATDDWDADNVTSSTSITNNDPHRQPPILANRLNIADENLESWAEQDPSTPQRPSFLVDNATENWDDDFLDKADSPIRRSSRTIHTPSKRSISGKLRAGVPLNHRKPSPQGDDEEHESWDDEFDFDHSPIKPPKVPTLGKSRRTPTRHHQHRPSLSSSGNHHHGLSDDDDDDDEDEDFGVAFAEEDRTVTARSRRVPQAHTTPSPPMPSIPFALIPLASNPSTSTNTHTTAPFPRSPTASVFSVPASSVAETGSLRSTAPLRPSLSRNAAGALKYLPPSPPTQRERRRLRKKSRPQPQGVMELVDMSHQYPLSDTDVNPRLEEIDERRTPSPPPMADPISVSVPPTPSQSTNTGGALLSRIGSVKRWTAARKKKGSSTPSEVTKDEKSKDSGISDSNDHPSPRPRTSFSSLLRSAQPMPPPPPASSWFFRPTTPVNSRGRNSLGKNNNPRSSFTGSRSGSMTDLSMRGSVYASSSNYEEDESAVPKTPNKLVKRKSLGFVQPRKGMTPSASGSLEKGKMRGKDLDSEPSPNHPQPPSKRPVSMQPQRLPSTMRQPATQRHASYGTAKKPDTSIDIPPQPIRDRKPSTVRPKAKAVAREKAKDGLQGENQTNDKEKEREEGNRGFMGSMRRLSIVGRHRRNKSGASVTNIDLLVRGIPAESSSMLAPTLSTPASTLEDPPSLPPLLSLGDINISRPSTPSTPPFVPALLPPIELQPPSPPRSNESHEPTGMNAPSLPQQADQLLSPISPTSSSSVMPMMTPSSSCPSPEPFSSPLSSMPPPSIPIHPQITPKAIKTIKSTTPPYTASLGRSTISPKRGVTAVDCVPRRSSLNDLRSELRIPARISQAQQGLKRDLGMVRDFAVYIDQLKKQQDTYHDLVQQMQRKLDTQAQLAQQPAQRAVSPSFFTIAKPKMRARSNTNPGNGSNSKYKELAAAFYTINSKYRISWECAELLVDLADGTSNVNGPSSSVSAPVGLSASGDKRGRERAVTLAGDESKPPTPTPGMSSSAAPPSTSNSHTSPPQASPPAWRGSTGRHDLSHRQLVLLKEMLNNAEAVLSVDGSGVPSAVPEEGPPSPTDSLRVNRNWRWGDPMSSTITLPSEHSNGESTKKKRRMSRLVGMTGIRDMLRALRKNVSDSTGSKGQPSIPLPVHHNHAMLSTASFSTDTSYDNSSAGHDPPGALARPRQGRKGKLTPGPEATKPEKERGREREFQDSSLSPPPPPQKAKTFSPKPSPRRPSLVSIFRLGRKHAVQSASVTDLSIHGSDSNYTDGPSRPGTSFGSNQPANTCGALEEDWDRMDSASDKDVAARALNVLNSSKLNGKEGGSTLKLRKGKPPYLPYQLPLSSSPLPGPSTPRRSASGSQLSLWADSPSKANPRMLQQVTPRAPRLSNVDEDTEAARLRDWERERRSSSSGTSGKLQKSGSVRSMPPQAMFPELKLAMTPENIKPLLENAKEIHARLGECIMEIRRLLDSDGVGERTVSGSTSTSASGQSSIS